MRSSATGCAGGLREVVRRFAGNLTLGHDYVLIGRRAALKLPFDRMVQDFDGALRRLHEGRAAKRNSR